jgi:hypothetical protein
MSQLAQQMAMGNMLAGGPTPLAQSLAAQTPQAPANMFTAQPVNTMQMQALHQERQAQETMQQQAMQAAEAQAQQAAQMQADFDSMMDEQDPARFSRAMMGYVLKYPQQHTPYKEIFDRMGADEKRARLSATAPIWSALKAGDPNAALNAVRRQMEIAPESERQGLEMLGQQIMENPQQAMMTVTSALFGLDSAAFKAMAEAENEQAKNAREEAAAGGLREKTAAETAAQYASVEERKATAELRRAETELRKLESSGAMTQEKHLKIQELKGKIAIQEQNLKTLQSDPIKKSNADIRAIDQTINVAEKLLKHEGFQTLFGTTWVPEFIPGTARHGAKALMNQLDAKSFLASIPQMSGFGALSEKEGAKVSAALNSINEKMSEADVTKAINEDLIPALKKMKAAAEEEKAKLSTGGPAPASAAQSGGVSSRQQAFDDMKKKAPQLSDAEINAVLKGAGY